MSDHTPAAVVNVQPAGNYVTREVFDATIQPISEDVKEMKADVKLLLLRDAGSQAVSGLKSKAGATATAVVAGSIGALIALFAH